VPLQSIVGMLVKRAEVPLQSIVGMLVKRLKCCVGFSILPIVIESERLSLTNCVFCMFADIGFATIPSGGGGTLFGGFLVKQLNLQCRGIFRLCLITTGTVLVLTLTLLARCENVPFAGISIDYVQPNRFVVSIIIFCRCVIIRSFLFS